MVSTIDFPLKQSIDWVSPWKWGGDRPVTADIDQWKVFMAGGLNKQFWRIEKTIYWGYKSVSDPNCPSPGAKLLQETKHDAENGRRSHGLQSWHSPSVEVFNSWNSGEKFHVDWLSWELDWWCHCVFYHDLSTIGKSPTSLRASGSRGRTSSYDMIWSELLYIYGYMI